MIIHYPKLETWLSKTHRFKYFQWFKIQMIDLFDEIIILIFSCIYSLTWPCIIQSKVFVILLSFHELHHESSLVAWISMIPEFWKSVCGYWCLIIIYRFIEIHSLFIQIHASIFSDFIQWYGYLDNWSCINLQIWSIFIHWLGLGQSSYMTPRVIMRNCRYWQTRDWPGK